MAENQQSVVETALDVRELSHRFGGRHALDHVSCTIEPGMFAILLGQNGAGKTTLFNLITRLYNNRAGHIRIFGTDMQANPTEALARLGVVFQQRTVDLDLSVRQNLLYHGGLHGLSRAEAAEQLDTAAFAARYLDTPIRRQAFRAFFVDAAVRKAWPAAPPTAP
jgi:ABC-2 type transport system ATP-binding protein